MGQKFDYFQQYVNELERQRVETAHQEHILEFQAMASKICKEMIDQERAQIKQECLDEMKQQQQKKSDRQPKIDIRLNIKDIERQVRDALRKAFK